MFDINYNNSSKEKIISFILNGETIAFINYYIDDYIRITNISENEYTLKLIDKLICLTYHLNLNYIYFGNVDLTKYHFKKKDDFYYLDRNKVHIRRFVKVGDGLTGEKNNICDVEDVKVSHYTLKNDEYNTGLTIISPHSGNIFKEKVVASSYSFNGFGKSIGLVQIEELGTIETNIVFTSTLNVGKISDAVVSHSLELNPEIGISTGTVNPVVMECNDGDLNNSRMRILDSDNYQKALGKLDSDFIQGAVGAGSGMICHGFKGGIGSASRIIEIDGKKYTIGVIVNANFGESNGKSLIFNNHYLGDKIKKYLNEYEDKGSIVAVLATDLPINERQIKRLLKRVEIGIGRTGSYAGNGSGDVFVGFTTCNKVKHFSTESVSNILRLSDNYINIAFKRTVECVEEAVLNSLLFGTHTKGFLKEVKSFNEVNEIFYKYLDEVIEYEV